MADKLDDIMRKLTRAGQHVRMAERIGNEFFGEPKLYTHRTERQDHGSTTTLTVRVVSVQPTPPMFVVRIGEAAHQLRSALDHVMWMLSWPVGKKQEQQVEFPIAYTRAEFVGRKGRKGIDSLPGMRYRMPRVARGVRAVVESLQPYNSRKCPGAESLGHLRAISNWDKHRTLLAIAGNIAAVEPEVSAYGDVRILSEQGFSGPLKPGAVMARVEVQFGPGQSYVSVKPTATLQPFFDDGMPEEIRGLNVGWVVTGACAFVEHTVIPKLKPFLI